MGYTRKDRMMNGMWPKSSKQFAGRLETKVLKLGLGIGASLLSGGSSSRNRTRRNTYTPSHVPLTMVPNSPRLYMSAKSAIITCIVLLALAPVFLGLGFVSYWYWGFWAFFSLLFFSTAALFCVCFVYVVADEPVDLKRETHKGVIIAALVESVLYVVGNLWPLFVGDSKITSLTYILMAAQDVLLIAGVISLLSEAKHPLTKKEAEQTTEIQAKQITPPKTRTSRTARIKDMEARFDKVKAALDEVKKAEDKLGEYSEDIDILRDYYESGKWQKDFEADEQGKLPKDLKRGVLSEDGLGDLLDDVDERI